MPQLADIMTEDVLFLLPDATVTRAAQEMKRLNVGVIPVCDDDKRLLGLITDRDIVVRVVAEGKDPEQTRLQEVATMDPIAGQREWDVSDAVELMSLNQIRRLPIVEDGRLVGIVALGDIAVDAEIAAGGALEEISKPAMPREGAINQDDHTA